MSELVGHAPLLLTAMLANVNNNRNAVNGVQPAPATTGTVVVHQYTTEVESTGGRQNLFY